MVGLMDGWRNWLVGWFNLVGWLVGWMDGWMVGWMDGWMDGWRNWLVGSTWLDGWCTNWLGIVADSILARFLPCRFRDLPIPFPKFPQTWTRSWGGHREQYQVPVPRYHVACTDRCRVCTSACIGHLLNVDISRGYTGHCYCTFNVI